MLKIAGKIIGGNQPCFIIAEAGVNHNGSFEVAKKMVDAAKEAGVCAVKFQTFISEELASFEAGQAEYQKKNTGKEERQVEMLKKLQLSYNDFRRLKDYASQKEIIFLSAPHSCKKDVDLVAELCPAIKIASGDLTNIPFLEYAASKNLPIILSTGMSVLEEIDEAVRAIKNQGNEEIILLHCTSNYPCPFGEVNLKAMDVLAEKFGLLTGYSDHTEGIIVPALAVSKGAVVIEKHFTLDKNMPGPDHKASLDAEELKNMVKLIRDTEVILGSRIKQPAVSEKETAKIARKSLVAKTIIRQGEIIKEEMLAVKRPGTGLEPNKTARIIGKKAVRDIVKDTLIKLEDLE